MKLLNFLKKDPVLCVAIVLAIVSMFIVTPDAGYKDYIDFNTLLMLFALMCVMGGLRSLGFFRLIGKTIINKVQNSRQLAAVLILLPFFFSMLITNDVALIIFVPLAITILKMSDCMDQLVFIVVFQTIAANLGSMLTPMGNPQNLYLYGTASMSIMAFIRLMLPYSLCALALLVLGVLGLSKTKDLSVTFKLDKIENKKAMWTYIGLFVLCALSVAKLFPAYIPAVACLIVMLLINRPVLKKVDYALLATFIGFFVFIGNMSRVETFNNLIKGMIDGNEMGMAVAASQVISNVPCALLLSGFTDNYQALIIGTNLGGLGTLIASMASLISYKQVVAADKNVKGRYFAAFTFYNVLFLCMMLFLHMLIK